MDLVRFFPKIWPPIGLNLKNSSKFWQKHIFFSKKWHLNYLNVLSAINIPLQKNKKDPFSHAFFVHVRVHQIFSRLPPYAHYLLAIHVSCLYLWFLHWVQSWTTRYKLLSSPQPCLSCSLQPSLQGLECSLCVLFYINKRNQWKKWSKTFKYNLTQNCHLQHDLKIIVYFCILHLLHKCCWKTSYFGFFAQCFEKVW